MPFAKCCVLDRVSVAMLFQGVVIVKRFYLNHATGNPILRVLSQNHFFPEGAPFLKFPSFPLRWRGKERDFRKDAISGKIDI